MYYLEFQLKKTKIKKKRKEKIELYLKKTKIRTINLI